MTLVLDIIFFVKKNKHINKRFTINPLLNPSGWGLFFSTKFEEGLNREGVLIQFIEDDDIVEKPRHSYTKLDVMQPKIKIKSELPSRE